MSENTVKPVTIAELLEDPIFFNSFVPTLLKIPSDKSKVTCEKPEHNEEAYEKISQNDYILSYKKSMSTSISILGHVQIFNTNKFFYTQIQASVHDLISDPDEVRKILAQHKKGEVKISTIYRKSNQQTSYIYDGVAHYIYRPMVFQALQEGLCLEKLQLENVNSQLLSNVSKIFCDNEFLSTIKQNTSVDYLKSLFKTSALKLAEDGSLHFRYSRYTHEQTQNLTSKYNEETNNIGTLNLFHILRNPLLEFTRAEIVEISTEILLIKADRATLEFNQDITPFFLDLSTNELKKMNQELNQKKNVRQDSFSDSIKALKKSLISEDVEFEAEIIVKGKVNINKLHQKIAPHTSMQFSFDPYQVSIQHSLETLGQITHSSNINFMSIVGRYINTAQEVINENFNNENHQNKNAFSYSKDGAQFVFHFGNNIDDKTAKEITKAIYENISIESLSSDDIARASIQKLILDGKIQKLMTENPAPPETETQYRERKNSLSL